MRQKSRSVSVCSAVGFASLTVFCQSFQASVSGIVTDPTGAVVPNVKVTVTDTARGVSFSTMGNQDGVYSINNLTPSTYTHHSGSVGISDVPADLISSHGQAGSRREHHAAAGCHESDGRGAGRGSDGGPIECDSGRRRQ